MSKLSESIVNNTEIDLDKRITWHLLGNHYPPLPIDLREPCLQAIELANLDYWDSEIVLPNGITHNNQKVLSVATIVELCHLETFINTETESEKSKMDRTPKLLVPTLSSVIADLERHLETLENEHAPITNGKAMNILRDTINHLNQIKESENK